MRGLLFMRQILLIFLLSISIVSTVHAGSAGSIPIPTGPQSDQIFAYPPDYFAVQVVAVKTKQQVLDLLSRYDLGDPPYGLMKAGGEFWYVLIYGVYPDYPSAKAAIHELPADLRKLKPWVRKMGPLQKAIQEAHPSKE